MQFYKSGESIEAQKAKIFAKKVIPQSIISNSKLGRLRKYTLERDGEAHVIKELDPKKAIYKETSNVNAGDSINCLKFFILAKEVSLKFTKTPYSGDHNTQLALTSDFTFAEISYPFLQIVNALEKRKILELERGNLKVLPSKK